MVNEYVTDDLASDSGDDAKIRKVEKRAKEKIDKKRRQQKYRLSQPRNVPVNPVQLVSLVLTCSTRIMVKEVFYVENYLLKDLIFVPSENSLTAHVTHVEPPGYWRSQCLAKFNFTKQHSFRPYVNPQFSNRAVPGNIQEQEKTGQP